MKYLQSVERQYQPSILHPEKLSFNTEEIKTFSDLKKKKKPERIHCPQTCFARNVKRNSSGRRKIVHVINSDLHKEKKGSQKKIKFFIVLYF